MPAPPPHFFPLVPVLLGVVSKNHIREQGRVRQDVVIRIGLVTLHLVQDLQQLVLDEVDEDEIDLRVVRHGWYVRTDEVWAGVVGL